MRESDSRSQIDVEQLRKDPVNARCERLGIVVDGPDGPCGGVLATVTYVTSLTSIQFGL